MYKGSEEAVPAADTGFNAGGDWEVTAPAGAASGFAAPATAAGGAPGASWDAAPDGAEWGASGGGEWGAAAETKPAEQW